MSINSLANAAAARRADFPPLGKVPQGTSQIAAAAGTPPVAEAPAAPAGTTASDMDRALHVLFGYIPTEVLTLYVAFLSVLHQQSKLITYADWRVFYAFLIATPIAVWVVFAGKIKTAQKPLPLAPPQWPVWEMFAGTVAYAAWAFGLPNSPFWAYKDSWYLPAFGGLAVLVASAVLGLLAPLFQRPLSS
jgi:hypothetical protein